ncbi:MAG: hypothetical protein ACKPJF_10830 [Dolichospermum sp.]
MATTNIKLYKHIYWSWISLNLLVCPAFHLLDQIGAHTSWLPQTSSFNGPAHISFKKADISWDLYEFGAQEAYAGHLAHIYWISLI